MSNKNGIDKEFKAELPQNVQFIGEHVESGKNIYIYQSVYKEIHRFTRNKTKNESGGVLMGDVVEALGKTNIVITGFIEAKFEEATPTTLTFTHESWDYIHKEIDKKYPDKKMVGWIHTHPNFGIFLSEYDRFIHENFFSEEYEVAYVVDPIQDIEGFYFWINGKIEKCPGFFICEKNGKRITVTTVNESTTEKALERLLFLFCALMVVCMFILGMQCYNLKKQIVQYQVQCQSEIDALNKAAGKKINTLEGLMQELESGIKSVQEQIDGIENRMDTMQEKLNGSNDDIQGVIDEMAEVKIRLEELEKLRSDDNENQFDQETDILDEKFAERFQENSEKNKAV